MIRNRTQRKPSCGIGKGAALRITEKHRKQKRGQILSLILIDVDAYRCYRWPFKSSVKTEYIGQQVGVMHACGHDAHMAILLGVAEVLASVRE